MLIVEDGTGKQNAESYVTAATCAAYAAVRGLSFDDDEYGEQALRRATTWLDARYQWPGIRAHGREQALQWPRSSATDVDGLALPSNEIPREIISALCEAAIRELTEPGVLSPDVIPGKIVQSAAVSGAVSVTYATNGDVLSQRPISTVIDDIVSSIVRISAMSLAGLSVRV